MKLRDHIRVIFCILLLASVVSAQSQKKPARLNAQSQTRHAQAEPKDEFRENFIKASEDYQTSLEELLVFYEKDVNKLSEQSAKLKELYTGGLISRLEYEKSTTDIAAAQVKVDDVRKQIARAKMTIVEARRQPDSNELQNAQMGAFSQIPRSWTTGNARIDALIRQNGARYGVDPYFIYCVIQQESSFSSTALSVKGAQGLMQLMPGTAARYGVVNANDAAQNIMGGTRYLKDLLQLFHGRIDLVLAGYNAGEGAVIRYGQTIPPYKETRNYVRLISQRYLRKPNVPPATALPN
ncbi:MAG TPA: lytic transglycosylase domain-containing protein [Pyrinomonadaceae bacterium]|nr:lytic transglycosylase domain-containing protein [Pyrinomonadaceae bacterium]